MGCLAGASAHKSYSRNRPPMLIIPSRYEDYKSSDQLFDGLKNMQTVNPLTGLLFLYIRALTLPVPISL